MLAKQKLAASAPVRPSLNTIEPFASLNARWAEMTRREDELTAELRPLVAEIRAAGGYARTRRRAGPPRRRARRLPPRASRELVADLVPFRRPGRRRRSATSTARRRRAAEISAELADITEAKKRLLPALNRARAEASAKVCDAVRPDACGDRPAHCRGADRAGRGWTAQTVLLHELAAEGCFNFNPAADRDPRSGRPARHHRPRPALGCRVRLHQPERGAAGMAGPLISHNEQEHER